MYKLIVILIIFLLGLYFISQSNCLENFTDNKKNKNELKEKCPDVLIQKGSALFLYNSKRANIPGVNPIRFENLEEYIEFTDWQRSQGILCPILFLQHAYNAQGDSVYKARPSPTNLQGGLPDYYVNPSNFVNPNLMPAPMPVSVQGLLPPLSEAQQIAQEQIPTACQQQALNQQMLAQQQQRQSELTQTQRQDQARVLALLPQQMSGRQPQLPPGNNDYPSFDAMGQGIGVSTPLDKMFNEVNNNVSPNPMDANWGGSDYTEKMIQSGYYKGNEVTRGNIL